MRASPSRFSLSQQTLGIDLDRTRRERLGALGMKIGFLRRATRRTDGNYAGYTGSVYTNRKVAFAAVGGLAVTDKD